MAPRRRCRSSSASSSSSEKRKRRDKKKHICRTKCTSSSSRRRERSRSYDFDDYYSHHHKHSPLNSRHNRSRRDFSYPKRRTVSSDSSDDHRHHRHRVSRNRRHSQPRRSCSRRKRISSSPDYSPSRDLHHHKNPVLAIEERKRQPTDSDIEILEEKRSRKKCCRSSSQERSNVYRWYDKCGKYLQEEKLNKAIKCINIALNLYKDEDDKFLSKIYSRRGAIYFLLEKPKCSFQAFTDWEHAYILDKDNMESRKNMSKVLFMGANKLYRKKAYSKALEPVMLALDLDKSNGEASILLRLIQKKLVEEIKRKDSNNLTDSIVSDPCIKVDPEKALELKSIPYSKRDISVFAEIQRLSKLVGLALEESNYPRAIIYVNKALRLYKEMPADLIFDQLFNLKQEIMNNVTRCPELTSD